MFWNKNKKIIAEQKSTISQLESELNILKAKVEAMDCLDSHIPKDCKKGIYCRSCEFSRAFHIPNMYGRFDQMVYLCNKGDICKNFVERNPK